MKSLLNNFESILRFSQSNDLSKKILFNKIWSEKADWETIGAGHNFRWSKVALEEWIDFYPTISMPIDYIEEEEKRKARDLQKANGDKKWGLEIGIRYFPEKEYFPPVFVHELVIFQNELVMEKALYKQKSKFKYLHMLELILAGYPQCLDKKLGNLYKHWLYDNVEEQYLLAFYEHYGIKWTDIKEIDAQGKFTKMLAYGAQLDSKMLNIQKKNAEVYALAAFEDAALRHNE